MTNDSKILPGHVGYEPDYKSESASSDLQEEPTRIQIGHKDGRVVLNFFGTSTVEPNHVALTATEAREIARHLIACADAVEPERGIRTWWPFR